MSEAVDFLLTVNTELVASELQKIETMLVRLSNYIQRLSGNKNLDALMVKIQQTINYVRALQVALSAVEAALIPGAGWVKAAFSGFAIANAAFVAYDMTRGY